MSAHNAYESSAVSEIMGETLRPGGFTLTDEGVRYCGLSAGDRVLDLGCGRGATVNYLRERYGIDAQGIDASEKMIQTAGEKFGKAGFLLADGEHLPFEDECFDCVMAECTLSLMDVKSALAQVYRVLKDKGWFIIADVCAGNPEAVSALKNYEVHSCIREMHDPDRLKRELEQAGFSVYALEDRSFYLKELAVKMIFAYGSMREFWNAASEQCVCGDEFYSAVKRCKPGYFLMIARRET